MYSSLFWHKIGEVEGIKLCCLCTNLSDGNGDRRKRQASGRWPDCELQFEALYNLFQLQTLGFHRLRGRGDLFH
ncbi:hypothetical protein ACVWWU_001984 [Pantoea sp. PA1]|nr:hypothetical protein [Pantoea ananatis]PWW17930.1 hypothetical protein DFO57_101216 [Pantoea sp. AG702]PVY88025.1 hypothetical protein C7427_101484 [Pantoea ananatis]PWK11834.1 hypothetical protein C7421_101210 [Pantoea ananatis]PWV67159.1 hypothetical protein C7425_103200 [Pantoea ananatis]